ncbi:MAG: IPT/TIG domain-containing protein, partial [Betaproteobacteria bacterium]|nr:IPT/TIG domain-containing protein [Betaproteobacteria bacterium]
MKTSHRYSPLSWVIMDCLSKIVMGLLLMSVSAVVSAQWQALSAPGQSVLMTGKAPNALAIAKNARLMAVGLDDKKEVAYYQPDTGASLGNVSLPKAALALALNDSGSKTYALIDDGITIIVIDSTSRSITNTWRLSGKPAQDGVAMIYQGASTGQPNNELSTNELLIADRDGKRIIAVNAATGVISRSKTLTAEPVTLALAADSGNSATPGNLYVGLKQGQLAILDLATLAVLRTVNLGADITALAGWPGVVAGNTTTTVGARALALSRDTLALIEPATGLVSRIALAQNNDRLSVEQQDSWAYLAAKNDDALRVIDLVKRTLAGYYTLPGGIGQIHFDPQSTGGGTLIASLTRDDKLLKLDPAEASLITSVGANVGVQKTLKDVAVNNTLHQAVVISSKDNDFTRINLTDRSQISTLALPVKAERIAIDQGSNLAIVAGSNDRLNFIDLSTTPPSRYPSQIDLDGHIKDLAVDENRHQTIVAVTDKTRIRIIDNSTRAEIAQISTPDPIDTLAVHPGRGVAYLITTNKKLLLLDLTTRAITQTVALPYKIEAIAIDSEINRAILTTHDNDRAIILDLNNLQTLATLPLPKDPGPVAIQPDSHIAVIGSSGNDGALSLINLTTLAVSPNINRLKKPQQIAVSVRYNQAFIVNADQDDLAIVQLPNPVPVLNSIAPSSTAAAGGPGTNGSLTLTARGQHFVDGAVILFGNTALVTTWVSPTQLTASVPAALLVAGSSGNGSSNGNTIPVRVQNPSPAGGVSGPQPFTLTQPMPVLDSISPASVVADGLAKTLTLMGSNFMAPASVRVSTTTPTGTTTMDYPATLVANGSLQVTLPANLINVPGNLTLAVVTAAGVSNSRPLTLTQPVPVLESVAPATVNADSTAKTLTLSGRYLVLPASVRVSTATPTGTTPT